MLSDRTPTLSLGQCLVRSLMFTATTQRVVKVSHSSKTISATRLCPSTPTLTACSQQAVSKLSSLEKKRVAPSNSINATENDALIFVGSGATSAANLLVNKLKLKSICEDVKLRQSLLTLVNPDQAEQLIQSKKGASTDRNYCKQNRWMSYDCTLCKVIMPSLGAYE